MGNPRVLRDVPSGLRSRKVRGSLRVRAAGPGTFDLPAMEAAVAQLLRASGFALGEPDLVGTPRRVAEAWAHELLDGYRTTPKEALCEQFAAPPGGSDCLFFGTFPAPGLFGQVFGQTPDLLFHRSLRGLQFLNPRLELALFSTGALLLRLQLLTRLVELLLQPRLRLFLFGQFNLQLVTPPGGSDCLFFEIGRAHV